MIDEERLLEISSHIGCLVPKLDAISQATAHLSSHEYSSKICDCEMLELIKLARLGLWTQNSAIPALEFYSNLNFRKYDEPGLRREYGCGCCAGINDENGDLQFNSDHKHGVQGLTAREALATL